MTIGLKRNLWVSQTERHIFGMLAGAIIATLQKEERDYAKG
jgi:hypothetical protein